MAKRAAAKKAKVDVLIPYWGDFGLLKKAVDSVLAQTEKDWRLLIIDDCYPSDEARKYYENFTDKRVHYHRHSKNLGLVKNYNYGINQATAEHCVIMGCDDMMLPTYLETALKNVGNAAIYQPSVKVIDASDKVYLPVADRIKKMLRPRGSGLHRGESIASSLCHGNWTYFPSLLWKTSTLKKWQFDADKPNTHDMVTILNIISDGGGLFVDDAVTFSYRRSATSFSSKAKAGTRFEEEAKIYNQLAEKFQAMGWKKAAHAARLHFTVRLHRLMS